MRIYNGTNSVVSLPYLGNQRINITAHSVSGDLGANTDLLSTMVSAYNTDELAIIVSGPFELNLCASIPTVTNYVVQTLEEAIERFTPKKEIGEEEKLDEECDECECDSSDKVCCPGYDDTDECEGPAEYKSAEKSMESLITNSVKMADALDKEEGEEEREELTTTNPYFQADKLKAVKKSHKHKK